MSSCRATLHYLDGNEIRPVEVEIRDARRAGPAAPWTECGFTRLDHVSAVRDWGDPGELAAVHEPEIEALARTHTGCDAVAFYPGILRSPRTAERSADLEPVRLVHSDYTEAYRGMLASPDHPYLSILSPSMERAGITAGDLARAKRIVVLQFWRSVGPRIVDYPLCFCDARTVRRESLVPILVSEYAGVRTEFESFGVSPPGPADDHHWYTYPSMECDEVAMFRAYDSDRAERGLPFWTPHTAFHDANARDAKPRESVEIRAICLFAG